MKKAIDTRNRLKRALADDKAQTKADAKAAKTKKVNDTKADLKRRVRNAEYLAKTKASDAKNGVGNAVGKAKSGASNFRRNVVSRVNNAKMEHKIANCKKGLNNTIRKYDKTNTAELKNINDDLNGYVNARASKYGTKTESVLNVIDDTKLRVFEAYENGDITENEKYEMLNTLESAAGEYGNYPTEDMLYADAKSDRIFPQIVDRQAINNPISALDTNATSSYDDTTSINPEFDDYSVKAADKEIVTKESVKLDIFEAYEAGEITEADKYELLAMIDD